MYYKNSNSIGIYKKDPKTQVFSFGGKKCSSSERVLRDFGLDALKKLDDGMAEENVRAWAAASIEFEWAQSQKEDGSDAARYSML